MRDSGRTLEIGMNLSAATAEIVPQSQLDPMQIRRLRSLFSDELLAHLLRTYREQAAKQIMEIQWAVAADDHATVRIAAHTLKSASFSVGATYIGELCAQLEANARKSAPAEATAWCRELKAQYEALLPELDSYIS